MKTLNAHFQVRYLPENRQTVKRRATKCKFVIRFVFISITHKAIYSSPKLYFFLVRQVWGIVFF